MKRRFKKTTAIVFALVLTMCIGASALAASRSGTLNGYYWKATLNQTSTKVTASTRYDKSKCNRSVSVTGTYIGPSFTGKRTKTAGKGYYQGSVSTTLTAGRDERFLSAKSYHVIDKISTTL